MWFPLGMQNVRSHNWISFRCGFPGTKDTAQAGGKTNQDQTGFFGFLGWRQREGHKPEPADEVQLHKKYVVYGTHSSGGGDVS